MKYPKPKHNGQCQIKIFRCGNCENEGSVRGCYPLVGAYNPVCPSCGARRVNLIRNYRFGGGE
jgi:hypothetical protein